GPLIHFISLCPKLLGLFRIVFQNFIARNVFGIASYNRRGEVMGWGAGALEDGLGDFFTVDGVGESLTAQYAFFSPAASKLCAAGSPLEDWRRLTDRALASARLAARERRVRDLIQDIEVAREQVCICCVL